MVELAMRERVQLRADGTLTITGYPGCRSVSVRKVDLARAAQSHITKKERSKAALQLAVSTLVFTIVTSRWSGE